MYVFMCISQKHNVVGSNTVVSINLFKISHCIHFVLFHPAENSSLLLLRVTLKPVIDCCLFKSHECNIHDVKPRLCQLKFGISLLLILQISCVSVHACNDHRSYIYSQKLFVIVHSAGWNFLSGEFRFWSFLKLLVTCL